MKKHSNPSSKLLNTNTLIEKIRNHSKINVDLRKTSGIKMIDKNIRNKSLAKNSKNDEIYIKITEEYNSIKNDAKLNNLAKDAINKYKSERDLNLPTNGKDKILSNISLFKANVNLNDFALHEKSIQLNNNILSCRSDNIVGQKPVLTQSLSIKNINNIPNSPADNKESTNNIKLSTNFTKFSTNSKHKKGSKSVSYNINLSSTHMLKNPTPQNQTNMDNSCNISFENKNSKDNATVVSAKQNVENTVNLITNYQNLNENGNILSLSSIKNMNKISTEATNKLSNSILVKNFSEVTSPEELHYLQVIMFKNYKNLAYSFENEDIDEHINKGNYEF